MKIISIYFIFCIVTVVSVSNASNVKNTSEIMVSATVQKHCNIQAVPFTFGDYQDQKLTAQTTVTVTCTNGTVYYLSVNQVDNAMMDEKNDILVYSVYQSGVRSQALGNIINKNVISGVGTGLPEIINLYAIIHSEQAIIPGSYEGKLHITLSF